MVRHCREWDARYGWDLLAEHGSRFDSSIAITSPRAWDAVKQHFPTPPRHVEFQQFMRQPYLDEMVARLPDADYVLAIGGGNAMDMGRYVAFQLGRPMVAIPTIVSTGAIFQTGVFAIDGDKRQSFPETVEPEMLLFDYGVIRAAEPRFNNMGMGECMCQLASVAGWRWWIDQGLESEPWDQAAADHILEWTRDRATRYSADLDADGRPNEIAIRISAEVNRERWELPARAAAGGHGIDHELTNAFIWVHDRELLHGEAVALGTLINNYVYDWKFTETKQWLDDCRVRYTPADIGCSHEELRTALDRIPAWMEFRSKPWENWFHRHTLDDRYFNRMLAAIEQ